MPLTGVATTPGLTSGSFSGSATTPTTIELYQWKGRMAGQPFDLGLYATYRPSTGPSASVANVPAFRITGRWGSLMVNGRLASPTAAQLKGGSGPARFSGTIGTFKVSGTVKGLTVTGNRHRRSATATFTVSK